MNLTESQEFALEMDVNMLVEAGAGSGKTFLFVERYAQLLCQDSSLTPDHILALTFTKKAAQECKERIEQRLNLLTVEYPHFQEFMPSLKGAPITTFHGFCLGLIQQYGLFIDQTPYFSVFSDDEQQYTFREAIRSMVQHESALYSEQLTFYLTHHSEQRLIMDLTQCFRKRQVVQSYDNMFLKKCTPLTEVVGLLFKKTLDVYHNLKAEKLALDYDDLIEITQRLLDHQDVQYAIQSQYKHVMIDECQDTDPIQWDIVLKCCHVIDPLKTKKLFLVGDSKQCIYRFRGAELSFFDKVNQLFRNSESLSKIVSLRDNFRSSPDILEVLNPLFDTIFTSIGDDFLAYVPLKSSLDSSGSVSTAFLKDANNNPQAECEFIASWLQRQDQNKSIVILARERSQCDVIYEFLKCRGFSVETDKQKGFFMQPLVVDCFQLLKGILNPADMLTWVSLLQSPLFGLNQAAVEAMFHVKSVTIVDMLTQGTTCDQFSVDQIKLVSMYLNVVKSWLSKKNIMSLTELLREIMYLDQGLMYVSSVVNGSYQVDIFLDFLQELEDQPALSRYKLLELLEYKLTHHDGAFELPSKVDQAIRIMTIHAAKGLEFDTVILMGCHRPFPLRRSDPTIVEADWFHCSLGEEEDVAMRKGFFNEEKQRVLAEEKRLFYVACTRAKSSLLLTGLYHKAEAEPCFSYLSFMKSLPDWTSTEFHVRFTSCSGQPVVLPAFFQALPGEVNPGSVDEDQSFHELDMYYDQVEGAYSGVDMLDQSDCEQTVSMSSVVQKIDDVVSLDLLQFGAMGSILHAAFMLVLVESSILEEDVVTFCQQQVAYDRLSSEFQQRVIRIASGLVKANSKQVLACFDWNFEYSLVYQGAQQRWVGRADGVVFDGTDAFLLEIKTDSVSSITDLFKSYQLQLELYVVSLFQQHSVSKVTVFLYSMHMDDIYEHVYTESDQERLAKSFD